MGNTERNFMKKLIVLLAVLCMIGVSAAEAESFTIGTDVIIPFLDFPEFVIVRPFFGYEKFFKNELDFFFELGIPVSFEGWDDIPSGIDINLGVTYNLQTSDTSKLAFTLQTWILIPFDDDKGAFFANKPIIDDIFFYGVVSDAFDMYLDPGVKFYKTFGFGELSFGLKMPFIIFQYIYGGFNPYLKVFDLAMLNFTFDIETKSGFGGGITLYNWIGEWDYGFMLAGDFFLTYRNGFFLGRVILEIPAMGIVPEVEFSFANGLSFFGSLPIRYNYVVFGSYSSNGGPDIFLGLRIGAKFSF